MGPKEDTVLQGIRMLELELVVRDFIDALNGRRPTGMEELLHPEVVYRPSHRRSAHGRDGVLAVCGEIWRTCEEFGIEITQVAVHHDVVLIEEHLSVTLGTTPPQHLLGFASFRFRGVQIAEWKQIHA